MVLVSCFVDGKPLLMPDAETPHCGRQAYDTVCLVWTRELQNVRLTLMLLIPVGDGAIDRSNQSKADGGRESQGSTSTNHDSQELPTWRLP